MPAPSLTFRGAAALLLPLLAAACSAPETFPPQCPSLTLLKDGADLKRFNGAGRDITDVALDAHITKVDAKCARENARTIRATLNVGMNVARGPQGPRTAEIPYFVAVAEGDRILDRQEYTLRGSFAPNVDRTATTGPDITLLLPVSAQKSATAYRIFVSFALTPDELTYNRTAAAR